MDSCNQLTCPINLLSAVHASLEYICSWKAGSPASNPLWLKLNLHHCSFVCNSLIAQLNNQCILQTNLGDHNSVTKPSAFSAWRLVFFLQLQQSHGHDATWMQNWCSVLRLPMDLKLLLGSGGFDITKGMDSLDTHFEHISFRHWLTYFQRWAAERLAATLPTQCSTIVHWFAAKRNVSQLRAQSISCNPNLGHNHCILRNKSWRPQLRDQTLCILCMRLVFIFSCNEGMGMMQA